jgi:hypothetical protein
VLEDPEGNRFCNRLARVADADLDALAGDLDSAAAGDLPADSQGRLRQRVGAGKADALQPVPLPKPS